MRSLLYEFGGWAKLQWLKMSFVTDEGCRKFKLIRFIKVDRFEGFLRKRGDGENESSRSDVFDGFIGTVPLERKITIEFKFVIGFPQMDANIMCMLKCGESPVLKNVVHTCPRQCHFESRRRLRLQGSRRAPIFPAQNGSRRVQLGRQGADSGEQQSPIPESSPPPKTSNGSGGLGHCGQCAIFEEEGHRRDKVKRDWPENGKDGFLVWRYELARDDPAPAQWSEEGKVLIKQRGLDKVNEWENADIKKLVAIFRNCVKYARR